MSVHIISFQKVELRLDASPKAVYDVDTTDVRIYPAGVGDGPMIAMPLVEWRRLVLDVDAIISKTLGAVVPK